MFCFEISKLRSGILPPDGRYFRPADQDLDLMVCNSGLEARSNAAESSRGSIPELTSVHPAVDKTHNLDID